MDKKEQDFELMHLEDTKQKLQNELGKVSGKLDEAKVHVNTMLQNVSSSFYDMDDEEKASMRLVIDEGDIAIFELIAKQKILKHQIGSPYFGRIDFKADDENNFAPYYIGISTLADGTKTIPYICDWRAPISTMYYDYETGRAHYDAPMGQIDGDINLKRQYKIANGQMQYMFDSNLTIGDDILKDALSHTTDAKMKNIVSTIQKEQNAIIRSDINTTLIVQGSAGSGKTSIALHRVAFLLYKYKEKISSKDILIVSPNKVFSDYISNVLPELGEQNVPEITFKELAYDELSGIISIEDRPEMIEDILSGNTIRADEIAIKSSFDFYYNIKEYLKNSIASKFQAQDIIVGDTIISKDKINELYHTRYSTRQIANRIDWIAEYVVDELNVKSKDPRGMINRIKTKLYKMFVSTDIVKIYSDFLNTQNLSFQLSSKEKLRYEDVAPVLLIKNYLLGINSFKEVKYLLIDEMQDYSPIHFELFHKMFKCPKTILGDVNQCFEKSVDFNYLNGLKDMYGEDSKLLIINKSYRSTKEIAKFAQNIIGLENVENVDRHGEPVETVLCSNESQMFDCIIKYLNQIKDKNYPRIAIVCKTEAESNKVYKELSSKIECTQLSSDNNTIDTGVIITSSALSKGLEFDDVIIPFVDKTNYYSKIDKNILYISCTRALHELKLFTSNKISNLIKE